MTLAAWCKNILIASATIAVVASTTAVAEPSHGMSVFGDLKYKAGFAHFDYVNPNAPKGGKIVTIGTRAQDTFDSFNAFILKGDAAQGLHELVYEPLMVRAADEPDAMYGLIAESADIAADKHSVTFKLRAEAKFADGTPVTADDCVFSFETLKTKGHPAYGSILRNVEGATKHGCTSRSARALTRSANLPRVRRCRTCGARTIGRKISPLSAAGGTSTKFVTIIFVHARPARRH